MVSGCFDLLHSGHVTFLEEAAKLGKLTVCIGSDATVQGLKGRPPLFGEKERAYMLEALSCVDEVRISPGRGHLDFLPELEEARPDIFFVNADGDSQAKREAVERLGVEYRVSRRIPREGLPFRSTSSLRDRIGMPYRLDLAGGWLDQPFVSELFPGPVVGVSLEPDDRYESRTGLATSTREKAVTLWGRCLPMDDRAKLAKLLFAFENPPGSTRVAGSQDAIGIVYPGLIRMEYQGGYWPREIETVTSSGQLDFLERRLYLRSLGPRPAEFDVLAETHITGDSVRRLAQAASRFWRAVMHCDAGAVGEAMIESFRAQVELFPLMRTPAINGLIEKYGPRALGYKVSGAGGGGYVVFFSDHPIPDSIRPTIRRGDLD